MLQILAILVGKTACFITINEPVDYMPRAVMILMRGQRHYAGHWKGWAMKVETFLGPETAQAKRTLPMALLMDLPASKTLHTGPCKS